MAWQCQFCGQQREGEKPHPWFDGKCPGSDAGLHYWKYYKSTRDALVGVPESEPKPTLNETFSHSSDDSCDCKYSIAQNIILLIEIVVGLIAGYIVRIDADISWNLLVYIGLQVTAVVMGKHDELNVFKRLVGSVCLYIFEAVVAQMCLSGGPFSFVIMLIVGVAPYFIHVAIPNIKEGNSIFGED